MAIPRQITRRQAVGSRRQRCLLFDVPEATTDTWGQPTLSPSQIVNPNAADGAFWCKIRYLQGNEQLNARQIWPTATHVAEMGWIGSLITPSADNPEGLIVPSMYLKNATTGQILNIVAAEDPELRHLYWVLTCEERVGATA